MTNDRGSAGTQSDASLGLLELDNGQGLRLRASRFGASIMSLHVPDRNGRSADILLGFDDPQHYDDNPDSLGCVVGRCANRIAHGRFTLDGHGFRLPTNQPPHHLHGGPGGFGTRPFEGTVVQREHGPTIVFRLTSPDGDQGYPGVLSVEVAYALTPNDELVTTMTATTSAPTLCNLAQHAYWNLGGHDSGDVADHLLTINADRFTPVDETAVPTGEVLELAGTSYDARSQSRVGDLATDVGPIGLDTNYMLRDPAGGLQHAATLDHPPTGRRMILSTDQPAMQVYRAEHFDGSTIGKGGARYVKRGAICLETQLPPNAINVSSWPSPVLRPGETYRHRMVHRFETFPDA